MVDYPLVRFVAAAGDTTARLDLNDGAPWETTHDGFDLGAPELETSPLAVGALYGFRMVTLTPQVRGGPAVVFPALSSLAVELQRDRNWLMFQYDADSKPFWLRTYRSAPQSTSFEDVFIGRDSSAWSKPIELAADAFARGARVDLPMVAIDNDPIGGGENKVAYVLPEIQGDAPAPLNVLLQSPTADNFKAPLISTSATEQAYAAPLIASTWTAFGSPKTTASAYVAGGYHAEPDAGDSAEGWATVTPPFAGRYKAYLRAGFSDVDSEFDLDCGGGRVRVTQRAIGNENTEPWVWWGSSGSQGWIDLGAVTLGAGWTPVLNPTLETTVRLHITRLNGNGKIRVDSLLFAPVDETEGTIEGRTLTVDPVLAPGGASTEFYADAETRQMWAAIDPSGSADWEPYILGGLSGRFPQVVPGHTNVLHLLRNINTGTDAKGDTTNVTLSYFPRRLDPLGV